MWSKASNNQTWQKYLDQTIEYANKHTSSLKDAAGIELQAAAPALAAPGAWKEEAVGEDEEKDSLRGDGAQPEDRDFLVGDHGATPTEDDEDTAAAKIDG